MRLIVFSVFLFVSIEGSVAQNTLPLSRTYANQKEELSRSVWAITQDKRGIIYLATDRGVVEYDGVSFCQLDTPPAYGIITDSSGVIYVSCKADFGRLITDPRGVVHFKSLYHFDEPVTKFEDVILTISEHKVCAISYLAALEYDRQKNVTTIYSPEQGEVFSNGFVENDTLYLSQTSKGLCYASHGKIGLAPYGDRFATIHNGKMNTSMEFGRGQRLLVFGPTLMRYFGKAKPPVLFTLKSDYLKDGYLYSSFSLSDHEKMITTINKGAILFDTTGAILNVYNNERRLPWNAIPNGLRDKNGNIWFTFEFNKTPLTKTEMGKDIRIWNKYSGMEGNVLSLNQFNGQMHVGTGVNLYAIDASENVKGYFLPNTYFVNTWLEFNGSGFKSRLIAVLSDHDVAEYKNGRMEKIYTAKDWCNINRSKKYPNRLYVLENERFGYLSLADDNWKYHELARLPRYNSFVEDLDGIIWLIKDRKNQIARMDPSTNDNSNHTSIRYFTAGNGLPNEIVSTLLLNGQRLFVTPQKIYTYNNQSNAFEPWLRGGKKLTGLLVNTTLLEKDTLNDILHLVSGNSLVSIARNKQGDTMYITNPYRRFENMGQIVGLSVDRQGVLWVAGTDGVIRYDRTLDRKDYDQRFQCLIRSVIVGKDSLMRGGGLERDSGITGEVRIPYDFDKLKISYAAPFFDKEEETLYSHRLIGRDKQWSDWEKYSDREYNDLFEGNYIFQVKARNIYGKESSISSFAFTVSPPLYRTWWMYIIYALGFIILFTSIWRWWTQSLRAKQRTLEQLVAIRTNELVQVNQVLHKSHQQLLETNKELEASQEELKQGNEELGATNEYLKRMQKQMVENEKMASLGQLTAGIAHEINNPINFISGGVQALEEVQREVLDHADSLTREELQERRKEISELMKSINNGVVRTSNIVKSLRTFSSPIESIDDRGTVDVRECIQDAVTLVRNKLQKANVTLVQNIHHQHGAKANASLIAQVLINLLDNAIYALEKVSRERVITISTEETASDIIIKVSDNADGIEEKVLARIFDPFFTTKEVGAGTGLGLWICYSIIEKHAGNITVKSELGKGTTFSISLPIGIGLQR